MKGKQTTPPTLELERPAKPIHCQEGLGKKMVIFSDSLKTFPRKGWPAAGTHQSAALAKVTKGKIPC